MSSASTILTLGIVVFPIILISTIFAGIIILHEPTLEASVTVEAISALTSAVLVDLLVWERLRDSL